MNTARNLSRMLIVLLCLFCVDFDIASAQSPDHPDHVVHVATVGENYDGCGSPESPCKTIQYAVNRAANGQWIRIFVAGGVYLNNANDVNPCERLQTYAVVCVINRRVELFGGYSTDNWSTPNPAANPTFIDGENKRRGVMILNTSSAQNSITMEDFVIRRGWAAGIPSRSGNDAISGFGAGMFIDSADGNLKHIRFEDNLVVGDDLNSGHGGAAAGGGLVVRAAPDMIRLEDIEFFNNRAEGGAGEERGGYAIGGAFLSYASKVYGKKIVAEGNVALGGLSRGIGRANNGSMADAQGGAFAFHGRSDILFEDVQVYNNKAIGGVSPNGNSGRAFGGGIFAEKATNVILRDIDVRGNLSQGGVGINDDSSKRSAGHARGGAMEFNKTPVLLERFSVTENVARGGDGQHFMGSPGGGGISFTSDGNDPATLINGVIADNVAEMGRGTDHSTGGGGGGLWIHGVNTTINHCTIARNVLQGASTLVGPALLSIESGAPEIEIVIENSIVAQHQFNPHLPALRLKRSVTAQFQHVLFSENSDNFNVGDSGPLIGLDTTHTVSSVNFAAPGTPLFNYRLSPSSPAVDSLLSSQVSADRDNMPRDGRPDMGAYELQPLRVVVIPAAKDRLRVSWTHSPGATSYRLAVACSSGSEPPANMDCDVPINLSRVTVHELTGLTPYSAYSVSVASLNTAGKVIAAAETISAFPTDMHVYLPIVPR